MSSEKGQVKLCVACMTEHETEHVQVVERNIFKDREVTYQAIYEYCPQTDQYLETEELIKNNSLSMKDAYRTKIGLLTSQEIRAIREIYGISQKDFSEVLDWGGATITRYENHQVQDRVHDDVLRKIGDDPRWFLQLLGRARDRLTEKAYDKYEYRAKVFYRQKRNQYLVESIHAVYADFTDRLVTGGVPLNLDKVVEIINYFATNVTSLHKVKLMKMLWYADTLHYKRYERAISGLVYLSLPMGAVPEAHDQIVALEGVNYEEVIYGDSVAYRFKPAKNFRITELSEAEVSVLDAVIKQVGTLNAGEIVKRMHEEKAYQSTPSKASIPFTFAEHLTIN